jgi:hypothetical protein
MPYVSHDRLTLAIAETREQLPQPCDAPLLILARRQSASSLPPNRVDGATLGNDDSSSTRPTFYFGKGFGDLPIGWARAFAITGELSYQIADKN